MENPETPAMLNTFHN